MAEIQESPQKRAKHDTVSVETNCEMNKMDIGKANKEPIHPIHSNLNSLSNFKLTRILNENSQSKVICIHGNFSDSDGECVMILEKSPFNEKILGNLLKSESSLQQTLQNDIYGTYEFLPKPELNTIKTTIIHPATQKHILKYMKQSVYLIEETEDDYKNITEPYIKSQQMSIQWVYNILDHKSEVDRIVFEDPDPDNGFILLPDMKWNREQVTDLYLVAICHKRGISSIRNLTKDHIPLLKNIGDKGKNAIKDKFGVSESQLRIYLHYQPSYYHLHIHFTHVEYDAPGTQVERGHLLSTVIYNLTMDSHYYEKAILTFAVKENDLLYKEYKQVHKV